MVEDLPHRHINLQQQLRSLRYVGCWRTDHCTEHPNQRLLCLADEWLFLWGPRIQKLFKGLRSQTSQTTPALAFQELTENAPNYDNIANRNKCIEYRNEILRSTIRQLTECSISELV